MKFPTADELRLELEARKRKDVSNAVERLKHNLEQSIRTSISNNALSASVVLPEELDETPLHLIKEGYEKLGYKVKFSQEHGTIGFNLVRMPRKFITLYW